MAAQQDYSQLKCFINGNPLIQITSLSKATNAGLQRIDLLNEGLGGFSNGSGDVTIEIGYVVPIGGTEEEFDRMCAGHEFVDMQMFLGRQSYAGRGKIENNSVSQSVNAAVEGKLTWLGELKPFAT